jgi:hypothetical protein
MVQPDSHKVCPLWYLGKLAHFRPGFVYQTFTVFGHLFQNVLLPEAKMNMPDPTTPHSPTGRETPKTQTPNNK